jgi:hypothetical protein
MHSLGYLKDLELLGLGQECGETQVHLVKQLAVIHARHLLCLALKQTTKTRVYILIAWQAVFLKGPNLVEVAVLLGVAVDSQLLGGASSQQLVVDNQKKKKKENHYF